MTDRQGKDLGEIEKMAMERAWRTTPEEGLIYDDWKAGYLAARSYYHHGLTIVEVEALLPNAKKVAQGLDVALDEAPITIGYISTDPIPEADLERAHELAREKGWIDDPEVKNMETTKNHERLT